MKQITGGYGGSCGPCGGAYTRPACIREEVFLGGCFCEAHPKDSCG